MLHWPSCLPLPRQPGVCLGGEDGVIGVRMCLETCGVSMEPLVLLHSCSPASRGAFRPLPQFFGI